METLLFEWDWNKAILNQKKHQVSFEEAKTVFYDENAMDGKGGYRVMLDACVTDDHHDVVCYYDSYKDEYTVRAVFPDDDSPCIEVRFAFGDELNDVSLVEAGSWTLRLFRVDGAIIDRINLRSLDQGNNDGIDVDARNVVISNSIIEAEDDGICLKGGTGATGVSQGPCEDILIQDCTVYHAHGGFVLGSDISGGIHKIVCRNLTLSGTDVGLRFKSGLGNGGPTSQIYCYNIQMNDIKDEAIIFDCTYINKSVAHQLEQEKKKKEGDQSGVKPASDNLFAPEFKDIHIYNIICRESHIGIRGIGLKDRNCVHDIDIHDCTLFYMEKATDMDTYCDIKTANIKYATY